MAFKSISMSKITLFIKNTDLDKVSNLIYDLKLVQLFNLKEKQLEKFETNDSGELSQQILKTRSAITFLKKYFKTATNNSTENAVEETLTLKNELEENQKQLEIKTKELQTQEILKKLGVQQEKLHAKDTKLGFIPKTKTKYFNKLTKNHIKYKSITIGKRTYFIAKTENEIPFGHKELYLPKKIDEKLLEKIEKLKTKIGKTKKNLTKLANSNLTRLRAKEFTLKKEFDLIKSQPNFCKTENIVVISAHIPSNKVKKLKTALNHNLEDRFELVSEKATSPDTPIKLEHNEMVGNFTELLKMYSFPKYGELDPTFFMFLTFPLFFGFILGDVIYGILSLFFFIWLKKKMPQVKEFITILQISAISSIIFGVIFGEFMGYEIHGSFYGLLARSHEANTLLMYAVLFGILHVNLGIILGFFNELPNWKHAICNKLSFFILQAGVGSIGYGFYTNIAELKYLGYALILTSLILIYLGHGVVGIMEVPSFFTNVLSYARLMAVGLSSVVIAAIVNNFTETFFAMGIWGIIGGVTIFTIGHIFNIILGNFEGFVHTLRLHYVEQMSKFYEGGGQEFKTFGEQPLHNE